MNQDLSPKDFPTVISSLPILLSVCVHRAPSPIVVQCRPPLIQPESCHLIFKVEENGIAKILNVSESSDVAEGTAPIKMIGLMSLYYLEYVTRGCCSAQVRWNLNMQAGGVLA